MKIKMTTRVIEGILCLAKPGVAHCVNFKMSAPEMYKRNIKHRDVALAREAVEWAERVTDARKAGILETKPEPKLDQKMELPVFEPVD